MFIHTRAVGFLLTEAIDRHVDARLEAALGPFSRSILKGEVRLDDVNADRGGIDKRCVLVVAMRKHGVEVAEAIDADLYRAIDKATTRIRRSVARAAKARLARERRGTRRRARSRGYRPAQRATREHVGTEHG